MAVSYNISIFALKTYRQNNVGRDTSLADGQKSQDYEQDYIEQRR